MAKALYLDDCYMKEFEAKVVSVKEDRFIILDRTAFYPNMGGQPNDTGVLIRNGEEFPVTFVVKTDGEISHEVSKPGLIAGDSVTGKIGWARRYVLMRYHTAAHVLSRIIYDDSGANTAGNQLGLDKSRIDFTLENLDREKIQGWIDKANEISAKGIPVNIGSMPHEQAVSDPGFSAPSRHLMPDIPVVRVVDITGFEKQACGGTHLKNTSEIGKMQLVKVENKGKSNRRIYFTLEE